MLLFFKSLSRTVHEEHDDQKKQELKNYEGGSGSGGDRACSSLTVWRKSLLVSCNGFTVIDSNGDLVYRVDNYMGRPQEIILMDASGKSLLTMRRCKNLIKLVDSWFLYEGEAGDFCSKNKTSKKPFCCVKKQKNILHFKAKVIAYVSCYGTSSDHTKYAYTIEGSYTHRSCKILDASRRTVAEIKRKEAIIGGISFSFGVEVFLLVVKPGFDPEFAMALVLILDQMFS